MSSSSMDSSTPIASMAKKYSTCRTGKSSANTSTTTRAAATKPSCPLSGKSTSSDQSSNPMKEFKLNRVSSTPELVLKICGNTLVSVKSEHGPVAMNTAFICFKKPISHSARPPHSTLPKRCPP
uniref:Uncharacterized protein n=1 Tax=Photinus pyralis TaxID=7054 RepID=A0A1Y1N727_PHOPY